MNAKNLKEFKSEALIKRGNRKKKKGGGAKEEEKSKTPFARERKMAEQP